MKNIIGIAAMLLVAAASQAWAQDYPNKPVHVIISFTPGSSTDIVGRIVLQKLSEIWGQPVIPENRSGAGGSIGTNVVAKAAPDGYTLLINSNAHTVKAAKAKPGSINWGHAGIGSGTHLNTEKFVDAAKINVTQVPFKGTPEVIQAMLSQSVDAYWAPISAAIPHIKGGRVRPFAVWGPAGIPAGIVNKISADTRKALKDPAVRDRLVGLGNDTMDMSPEEFKIFVRSEVREYARVVKAAGIQPQ